MELEIVSLIIGIVSGIFLGLLLGFVFWGRNLTRLKIEKAELKTTIEKERESFRQFSENKKALEDTFKSLAHDALMQNSENFIKLALESLKNIEAETKGVIGEKGIEITSKINDLKNVLEKFDKNVKDIEIKRENAYTTLQNGQTKLDKTTTELLGALKFAKGSGNWGEIQLERIAEISGMVEHCDYNVQVPAKEGEQRYLADMVVNLPQGRKIIIDAKTPVSAFLKSLDEKEINRENLLKEFIENVYSSMKNLSEKEYFKKYEGSLDFVVMFIPSEAMFSTVIEKKSSFVEDCVKSKVIPASPLNLIALLKSVAYSWKQIELENQAKIILEKSKAIYEGLCSSSDHLANLGKSLHKCVENYNTFIGSVERNVFPKGREISRLSETKHISSSEEVLEIPRELKAPDWKKGD